MTAPVELVPVDEVGIDALGPAARRGNDLPVKDAAAHGHLDDGGTADDVGILDVRQGKRFELEVAEADDATLAEVREIAETLLSNPVIEDFTVRWADTAGTVRVEDAIG